MSQPIATSIPPQKSYDIVIIGAGGMGSAAAYHCARDGLRVLLLEQFKVGHVRGSSHGDSRIIRYAHNHIDYASQMPATFQLWFELEALGGVRLLQPTDGIYLGHKEERWLLECHAVLSELGMAHEVLEGADIMRHYPQFKVQSDWLAITEKNAGILAASLCVQTMVTQAVRFGATVRENASVIDLHADGDGVLVRLANGEALSAQRAIVAAGPWSSRFFERLVGYPIPLRVAPQQVAYFPVHDPSLYALGRFPLFIVHNYPHFYGFPIYERAGLIKVALEQNDYTQDPDEERTVNKNMAEVLSHIVANTFVGVDPRPVSVEPCLYTNTPTQHFVIDRHPEHPQIAFAAGFSGRGFKHTIAVGRLLADIAQSDAHIYASQFWSESYRLDRFAPG